MLTYQTSTGVCGIAVAVAAGLKRAEIGGSFTVESGVDIVCYNVKSSLTSVQIALSY